MIFSYRVHLIYTAVILLFMMAGCSQKSQVEKPVTDDVAQVPSQMQLPPRNPFYADSTSGTMHGGSVYGRFSMVPGPIDVGRPLTAEEIIWRPAELANWSVEYSGVYPDGRRVLWLGGGKVLFKYDADTLEFLASTPVREGFAMSEQEINALIEKMDAMPDGDDYYKLALETILPEMAGAAAAYKVVSNENEVYVLAYEAANKKSTLRVYGDAIEGDAASPIELKREWVLPKVTDVDPFGFIINMTFDGRVIVTTRDGTIFSVSRDLQEYTYLVLPRPGPSSTNESDTFIVTNSFVRNATPTDPDGGVYVVTGTEMHRVQWTGEKLSLDAADGAWSVPYAGGELGSGTSPALMGWGDDEDHLVVIGDGRPEGKMHLWAFWRDEIPVDWKGIEGMDRRVAGIAPVDYGKYTPDEGTIENSLPVKGYGVLVANDHPATQVDYGNALDERFFAHIYSTSKGSSYVSHGAMKYVWNPVSRKLELAWTTDLSFTTAIPIVDIGDTVYTIGMRDGMVTMEALDWHTGASKYYYDLGKSIRYLPNGSSVMIAPNGALDCYCQGGVGVVRIQPKIRANQQSKKL